MAAAVSDYAGPPRCRGRPLHGECRCGGRL